MSLSIILPCYNPPPHWDQVIADNCRQLEKKIGPIQLILVDDGSQNGIGAQQVADLKKEIPSFQLLQYDVNKGKGHALRTGVAAASGEYIIYTDVDFPYDLQSILSVYEALHTEQCDVAIGVKNEDYYKQVPPARKTISKLLRRMIGIFLRMPVTDTQCGLKGFRAAQKRLFLSTTINRYLFDLEFVRLVFNNEKKLKVKAVPVQLNPDVHFRKMNYKILLPELANFIAVVFRKK